MGYIQATWDFGDFYGMFARDIEYEEYMQLGIDEVSSCPKSAFWGSRKCHLEGLFRGTGVLMGLSLPPITPSNWAAQVCIVVGIA